MKLPVATDLKTRTAAPDKDAHLKNCYVEISEEIGVVRKRPAVSAFSYGSGFGTINADATAYPYTVFLPKFRGGAAQGGISVPGGAVCYSGDAIITTNWIVVAKVDASANIITVSGNGHLFTNGQAYMLMNAPLSLTFIFNGSTWDYQ